MFQLRRFSWPPNETRPYSIIHTGPKVKVFSVQSYATMESHALVEAVDFISKIKLPTVIKVEEIQRDIVSKALKNFDWKAKNIEVKIINNMSNLIKK